MPNLDELHIRVGRIETLLERLLHGAEVARGASVTGGHACHPIQNIETFLHTQPFFQHKR